MNIASTIKLSSVAMPIVEVMSSDGLSWADREKCAFALRRVMKHFSDMEKEGAAMGISGAAQVLQAMHAQASGGIK